MTSKLMRARNSAMAGVCAGLAEYFDLDTIVVRILAVLICLITGPLGLIAYLVLWAAIPLEPERARPFDITPERAESNTLGNVAVGMTASLRAGVATAGSIGQNVGRERVPMTCRIAVAVGLMALFFVIALNAAPLLPGTQWWQFWPVALLIFGLCLIVVPIQTNLPAGEALLHVAGIVIAAGASSILPMSLNVLSWNTLGFSLDHLWALLLMAVLLFTVGVVRNSLALMMLGAFCVVMFFVFTVALFAIPGEVESLVLMVPGGGIFVLMPPRAASFAVAIVPFA